MWARSPCQVCQVWRWPNEFLLVPNINLLHFNRHIRDHIFCQWWWRNFLPLYSLWSPYSFCEQPCRCKFFEKFGGAVVPFWFLQITRINQFFPPEKKNPIKLSPDFQKILRKNFLLGVQLKNGTPQYFSLSSQKSLKFSLQQRLSGQLWCIFFWF